MYKCEKCGACCRNISKSNLYQKLDRGDGVCKYLRDNLCEIYNNRPVLCRIDECFELYFSKRMSQEQYYKLNRIMCKNLQNKEE